MKDRKILVIKLIAGSNTPITEEVDDELQVYQEFVGIRPEDEGEFGSFPPSALITVDLIAYQAQEYEKRTAAEEQT